MTFKRKMVSFTLALALVLGATIFAPPSAEAVTNCWVDQDPYQLWWTEGYCGIGVLWAGRCWETCCTDGSCVRTYYVCYECRVD